MQLRQCSLFGCLSMLLILPALSWPKNNPNNRSQERNFNGVAGTYYRGNGLGQNDLQLDAKGGFTYEEATDVGNHPDEWSGTYTVQKNLVSLFLSETSLEKRKLPDLRKLVKVSWGKRLYLLDAEEMRDFCNDINLGYEPRGDIHGDYFMRIAGFSNRRELDRHQGGKRCVHASGQIHC